MGLPLPFPYADLPLTKARPCNPEVFLIILSFLFLSEDTLPCFLLKSDSFEALSFSACLHLSLNLSHEAVMLRL